MTSAGSNVALRAQVQAALTAFADTPLPKASTSLLNSLGYTSKKTADLGSSAETLLANIEQFKPELGKISRDKVKADRWKSCTFLFQLTNDEIPSLLLPSPAGGVKQASPAHPPSPRAATLPSPASGKGAGGEGARSEDVSRSLIESFVFLAIELQGESWSRTDLAAIVRELNRRFPMPAIVIFRHGELLSLAVIDRRAKQRLTDCANTEALFRVIQ